MPHGRGAIEASVESGVSGSDIKRWWLHQANINMNDLIAGVCSGIEPGEAPVVLDRYVNAASKSLIAFNLPCEDLRLAIWGSLFFGGLLYRQSCSESCSFKASC